MLCFFHVLARKKKTKNQAAPCGLTNMGFNQHMGRDGDSTTPTMDTDEFIHQKRDDSIIIYIYMYV